MSLGGPSLYPGSGLWIGISREITPRTPPEPVTTNAPEPELANADEG